MRASGVPDAELLLRSVEGNGSEVASVTAAVTHVAPPPEALTRVSVTRLLNPARAYFELVHPLEEDLPAHQARLAGSGAHALLESTLTAGVPYVEMWLRGEEAPGEPSLEGITARIDAAEPTPGGAPSPTEIKNVGGDRERPSDEHLEQLGMYCALLGAGSGRILLVRREDASGSSRLLVPWKVSFPDLAAIREEMALRRDLLLDAYARKDPSGLPSCAWRGRGCPFDREHVCSCGVLPPAHDVIHRQAEVVKDPEYLELLQRRGEAAARAAADRARASTALTWRTLFTPRLAYFEALARRKSAGSEATGEEAATAPSSDASERSRREVERVNLRGLERQLFSSIRRLHGPEFRLASTSLGDSELRTPCVGDVPFAVRIRHVARPLDGSACELVGRWGVPDDLRQLALRASLLGTERARIYVWNWKVSDPARKLQVFDVRFDPARLCDVRAYAEGLPTMLEGALSRQDHRELPLCPRWRCPSCPFREACRPDDELRARDS